MTRYENEKDECTFFEVLCDDGRRRLALRLRCTNDETVDYIFTNAERAYEFAYHFIRAVDQCQWTAK